MLQSFRFNLTLSRGLQLLVLAYQALAVMIFVAAIFLALSWLQVPFLGAFFEQTLVANGATPSQPSEAWQLHNQGITLGEQIISVFGNEVHSEREIRNILMNFSPGESIPVVTQSPNTGQKLYEITLYEFPSVDRDAYFVIPMFVSVSFLAISFWIFGLRRTESAGRAFVLFSSSLAIITGTLFDLFTTHRLTYFWTFSLAIAGGALVDLTLSFPQEAKAVIGRPYFRWLGYFIALVLVAATFPTLNNINQPTAYFQSWLNIYMFLGVSILFYLGTMIYRATTTPSPVIKSQTRTILFGAAIGLGPMAIWLLLSPLRLYDFKTYLFIPLIFFPLAIGYTILRYRLLRTDTWLRQGLAYAILSVFAVGGYGLIVTGLSLIFKESMPSDNVYLVGGLVFILAIVLDPFRKRLLDIINSTFFRGQREYEQRLRDYSHDMTNTLDMQSIGLNLRQQINDALAPEHVHIYTFDILNDQFVSLPDEDGQTSSDVRFSSNSALAQYFSNERLPLYLDGSTPPEILKSDESRLNLLDAKLFVALPGKDRPIGWLALGHRLSGQPYTPQDLTFLENLADQSSVAISRVQTVANLERRIQEMNALTRVSQGVNITLTFDDVMELIFAQTGQIIPSSEFHVTLYSRAGDYYYYAFCVENRERLNDRESSPLPLNLGLGQEVVQMGRPILTQDYLRECQTRNTTPAFKDVYAWMGVPLNAGAETIGSLSIGSRDPSVTYSNAQLDLLQAIADQTAGAIVKSRLLQETQQRAFQLATLNDLTRQLTSTLELEPLLQNILENAVSILNCEAGSLFLVDEQTDEMIFKVTVGPPASADLVGQRVPAGSGIVGRAAQSRMAVIENQAQTSPDHFITTDQQTGFTSKSLLAVPLLFKDRVIGVIEVINRQDGIPFIEDDQTLLSAFAGQAAVAIENARLYTLTDQELAARVEELSVMQRIDRELNASLEIDRAMRITLEWAMRQSGSEAGLIGILAENNNLRVMAQQGYGELTESFPNDLLPMNMPSMKLAMDTSQPQQYSLQSQNGDSILPNAHTQLVIPIRRESNVIGLIFTESTSDTQQDIAFLNRLSDHAAIAISNAQLYQEVQRANEAKSEFVSFVAHELKNPMTSIKGYTELLAGGKVGTINEMQTNFLSTIHANVERMATLVSDLNDNSKIEAGRLRLEYKAVDVSELSEEAIKSASRQIDDKKQIITRNLPENLPKIWADHVRISQVLTNLISNAHKYTPEGGEIIVGAEVSANQWDPVGAAQVVHIWVKDNGIGISLEDNQKIFTKFFRSDDQKAREVPGTGLGLNITKSLVEMQGGQIWFESEFRKGTTFHFTVPIAEE
jgi:signal transduction histidine kinase/putative methionine-R-sulfoxide reductase with GAF domain